MSVINRWLTLLIASVTALILLVAGAYAGEPPSLPPGVTCEIVRAKVAEHGRLVAFAWAKLNGYSTRDIAEARKCLR